MTLIKTELIADVLTFVKTALVFDFEYCGSETDSCLRYRNACKVVLLLGYTGEDVNMKYFAYRLTDLENFEPLNDDYSHVWGFGRTGYVSSLANDLLINDSNTVYASILYSKNKQFLYVTTNESRILYDQLNPNAKWSRHWSVGYVQTNNTEPIVGKFLAPDDYIYVLRGQIIYVFRPGIGLSELVSFIKQMMSHRSD